MPDMRLLVCGIGRWGNQWLDVLAAHPGVLLAGTAGGRVRRLPDAARRTREYRHHSGFVGMLESVDADAAIVTLPVRHHAEAIELALRRGMHVLCEKPLVTDEASLRRVLVAAEAHPGQIVMVGQNYRHRPWARAARWMVDSGRLGDVAHMALRFSRPEFLEGRRDRLRSPLMQDMSIHHLDLIRYITGKEAYQVFALEHRPPWSLFPGAPSLEVVMKMVDESVVTYSGTWAARGPATSYDGDVVLYGERGVLTCSHGKLTWDGEAFDPRDVGWGGVEVQPESGDADLHSVLRTFRRAVLAGEPAETDLEDNRRTVELLLAVERSALTGVPVLVQQQERD